jgi:uncharacterized protein DUF1629
MNVYQFDTQDHQAYLYASDDVCRQCRPDPPRSLAAHWSPPTFELVRNDEHRSNLPKSDFPIITIGMMVLSARAVARLRPILDACGEILPIRLSNDHDTFYLFNITRVINAVDMKRSRFMELPSGSIGPCELLIFNPALIPADALFFKTTQMGPATRIFATERAVVAVLSASLTGYEFRIAWTNEQSA